MAEKIVLVAAIVGVAGFGLVWFMNQQKNTQWKMGDRVMITFRGKANSKLKGGVARAYGTVCDVDAKGTTYVFWDRIMDREGNIETRESSTDAAATTAWFGGDCGVQPSNEITTLQCVFKKPARQLSWSDGGDGIS